MDERKLQELFRDAASVAPQASFDEQDVLRGSRRVTARRRMAVAGGSFVAATVLAGGVTTGTGMFSDQGQTTVAQPPATVKPAPRSGENSKNGPWVMSVPTGGGECAAPDPELAKALAAELPEAAGASPVAATGCPSGSTSAAFSLPDGRVTAVVSPVGTVPPDQLRPGETQRQDGTKQFMAKAHSGRIVLVSSRPNGSSAPPHGDNLGAIAGALAPRF